MGGKTDMTLKERIAYAEGRRDEAIANGSDIAIIHWRGYVEGLHAHLRDKLREEERETRKQKEEG